MAKTTKGKPSERRNAHNYLSVKRVEEEGGVGERNKWIERPVIGRMVRITCM